MKNLYFGMNTFLLVLFIGSQIHPVMGAATTNTISNGRNHACYTADDTLYCWGQNNRGQLGLGDGENRGLSPEHMLFNLPSVNLGTGLSINKVRGSASSSCALVDGDRLKCWGSNEYGQLGYGDTQNRGDDPGEMGDNLPFVDFGENMKVLDFGMGVDHVCALVQDETNTDKHVACFGRNNNGQLGIGNTENRGDEEGEMGDSTEFVDFGTSLSPKKISVGANHNCAILEPGDALKCWGRNSVGQLGYEDSTHRGSDPSHMGDNLGSVLENSEVYDTSGSLTSSFTLENVYAGGDRTCVMINFGVSCWGGPKAPLGLGNLGKSNLGATAGDMDILALVVMGGNSTNPDPILSVAMTDSHTCFELEEGQLKCVGQNSGNLGQGDSSTKGDTPSTIGNNLPFINFGTDRNVVAYNVGGRRTCVSLSDGLLTCFGDSTSGQLGLGIESGRGTSPDHMGDNLLAVELAFDRTPSPTLSDSGNDGGDEENAASLQFNRRSIAFIFISTLALQIIHLVSFI